jgi:hypothetical protein
MLVGMPWSRTSSTGRLPADPAGEMAAAAAAELFPGAAVELTYTPTDTGPTDTGPTDAGPTDAGPTDTGPTDAGPPGWHVTCTLTLSDRIARLVTPKSTSVLRLLDALPAATLRTAQRFRAAHAHAPTPLVPPLRRALRDTLAIELLAAYAGTAAQPAITDLLADTVEYLIELGGARLESEALTHGVIITDALPDRPRLRFDYPAHLRDAKRAPVLFDGQRALLVVDRDGHARTEIQRHRLARWERRPDTGATPGFVDSGAFVAEATRRLGGVGFFLRADHTIWTFVDGQPLVLRRGEHWTTFPLQLIAFLGDLIGGARATQVVVQAALIVSGAGHGGILAIVEHPSALDEIVSPKDRYDLRDDFDPTAMRPETRLHHLLDAAEIDDQTLARLAGLDGATIVDRDANLLAYGAIVTSSDSEHEGARTAAAKSLSLTADIVLKVSEDGDITVFHRGDVITTLLGSGRP